MRCISGKVCIRILIVSMLLYMIVPSSWVNRLTFKKRVQETQMTEPSGTIVPNIVHFIRFGEQKMTFIDAVCLLAALKNQKPHTLYIHTDQRKFDDVWGKYWKVVLSHPTAKGVVQVKYLRMPRGVFGKSFNPYYVFHHASDVERLRILIKYGGIYLDSDSYVVKRLDRFFDYEMTLGWENGGGISDQVLIAKKDARYLKLWLESYRDYRRGEWFYNAGAVPTEILKKHPELVHAVNKKLAEYQTTPGMLYLKNTDEWKTHYAIHLLINHQYILGRNISAEATYPVEFNENNILKYPVTIRQMVLDVYPFEEVIKKRFEVPQNLSRREGNAMQKRIKTTDNFTKNNQNKATYIRKK